MLFDKMCKYEMDPANIMEDTEQTRFCPQTDEQTDGRTTWNQYIRFQLHWSGGYTSDHPFHWGIYVSPGVNVWKIFICQNKDCNDI